MPCRARQSGVPSGTVVLTGEFVLPGPCSGLVTSSSCPPCLASWVQPFRLALRAVSALELPQYAWPDRAAALTSCAVRSGAVTP